MLFTFIPTFRRRMRRHQGVPTRAPRMSMWRLLAGELAWSIRQLLVAPWVLAGMTLGVIGTLAVLGAGAPGPVPEPHLRVLLAIAVGLLLGAGGRALRTTSSSRSADADDGQVQVRPLTAATIVAAVLALVTLTAWLLVWLGSLLA